ncbi:MAG TPA: hypothetical protein VIJ31_03220 [Acidothermaceae bacterium]
MCSLVALIHRYATRPSLVVALSSTTNSDSDATINQSLLSLADATPGISAAFVTDIHGVSRYVYPSEPSVIGTSVKTAERMAPSPNGIGHR